MSGQFGQQAVDIARIERFIAHLNDGFHAPCRFQPGIGDTLRGAVQTHEGFEKMFFDDGINLRIAAAQSVGLIEERGDFGFVGRCDPFVEQLHLVGLQSFLRLFDNRPVKRVTMGRSRSRQQKECCSHRCDGTPHHKTIHSLLHGFMDFGFIKIRNLCGNNRHICYIRFGAEFVALSKQSTKL